MAEKFGIIHLGVRPAAAAAAGLGGNPVVAMAAGVLANPVGVLGARALDVAG